ncbi:MAG: sulfotransferase domain-containing protein [Pseudomonadota bacterium]
MADGRIKGKVYAQCGLHKCMTMYARRAYRRACRAELRFKSGIRHYGHDIEAFYTHCTESRIASVSGHALDLDRFEDIKVVRLIRDPRDLLVSAYHYHKRGAEPWCHTVNSHPHGWDEVRGYVPEHFRSQHSMMSYLDEASRDDAMRLEYAFRRHHLTSLREWPEDDPRIRTYRYEDILGDEEGIFGDIFSFMEFGWPGRAAGLSYVRRHASERKAARRDHIRDATSGQWRDVLPQDVIDAMARDFGDVLERYGYPER